MISFNKTINLIKILGPQTQKMGKLLLVLGYLFPIYDIKNSFRAAQPIKLESVVSEDVAAGVKGFALVLVKK